MPSPDVQNIIDRILASPRVRTGNAFAGRVFTDEPIIRRGSQMAGYLPPRCREMREIATSPEAQGKPVAWVFLRQARLMADYTDDVEYHGVFEHYYPTYQDMSDRQLRGYFTWRAAVRAGDVRETSLSFVFVHLYELLCGVGTTPGVQGFHDIERFWQVYREFEPKLDRYVRPWLRDYAAWHALDASLLAPYVDLGFDRALVALRDGIAAWEGRREPPRFATPAGLLSRAGAPVRATSVEMAAVTAGDGAKRGRKGGRRGALAPDGSDNPVEESMFSAFDVLSSYRPRVSRLHRDRPETLRHVCCAVIVQLARHYDAHRKTGLMESLFGSPLAIPYEMFSSAVFWSDSPHPDAIYELDEVNRYTCARRRWYWEGYHGSHSRSTKLGSVLRAVDQRLRDAIGYEHPLTVKDVPKYLAKIIDREIEARLAWEHEREARTIHVDLSQLAGIRAAAAETREALLVDEERESAGDAPLVVRAGTQGTGQSGTSVPVPAAVQPGAPMPVAAVAGAQPGTPAPAAALPGTPAPAPTSTLFGASAPAPTPAPAAASTPLSSPSTFCSYEGNSGTQTAESGGRTAGTAGDATSDAARTAGAAGNGAPSTGLTATPAAIGANVAAPAGAGPLGLSPEEVTLLRALLDGAPYEPPTGTSLDMLVDDINEKLFDLIGDTALEFDMSGRPAIIEDYLEDVRGAIRP